MAAFDSALFRANHMFIAKRFMRWSQMCGSAVLTAAAAMATYNKAATRTIMTYLQSDGWCSSRNETCHNIWPAKWRFAAWKAMAWKDGHNALAKQYDRIVDRSLLAFMVLANVMPDCCSRPPSLANTVQMIAPDGFSYLVLLVALADCAHLFGRIT